MIMWPVSGASHLLLEETCERELERVQFDQSPAPGKWLDSGPI